MLWRGRLLVNSLKSRDMLSCSVKVRRLFLLSLMVAVGCAERAPELETWPVHGTVIDQNGVSPASGVVRFLAVAEMHRSDPHLITVGPIQPDGSFTVKTHRKGFDYDGAVAGDYGLLVITDKTNSDGQKVPVQFDVPEPCTVQPGENKLTIKIQR